MSKWLSRECALADISRSHFVEVGYTDFSGLVPGTTKRDLKGAVNFTVSLCGKFFFATHENTAYIYELNHVCYHEHPRWSVPLKPREGLNLGLLRPISIVQCPRRIICCSMDTSAGRNAAAFLMDGRTGLVAQIDAKRLGPALASPDRGSRRPSIGAINFGRSASSTATSTCVCKQHSPTQPLPAEEGSRSIFVGACHPEDPPRSVALCPKRNCIAFGCESGIELNWSDALTGEDLSRWFPLTSPSDYLYFLPPRQGIDTAKKLRLISSATTVGAPLEHLGNMMRGFNTRLFGHGSAALMSFEGFMNPQMGNTRLSPIIPSVAPPMTTRELLENPRDSLLRRVSASTADHYRALPLSDGFHILFTDPCSGNLCLGTDAPVGTLTRLLRKVWFPPPPEALSPVPILYAAGSDVRHGVRVVATFEASSAAGVAEPSHVDRYSLSHDADSVGKRQSGSNRQIIMFYTIPPDMFHDIARAGVDANIQLGGNREDITSDWVAWRADLSYHEIDVFTDPYAHSEVYPVEILGQRVAACNGLTEIALDSGPDMVVWAFSAEGWARAWAFDTGRHMSHTDTRVHVDGSLRFLDANGDVVMADEHTSTPTVSVGELAHSDGIVSSRATPRIFQRDTRTASGIVRMSGTVSVDLVEEAGGITRVDVELQ